VTCAAELSGCDYSAEAEIRRAEGEGEMSNRNRKWSPEDDRRLLELKEAGAPLAVIAEELKRTQSAIDSRTNALKNHADPALRRPHDEGA
jgi:hypothetical protein